MRRSPFTAGRMRWGVLALVASLAALFMVASGAQAAVVNDQGTLAGVAMIPGTNAPAGLPVTASGQCQDPWLESDLGGPLLPSTAICYRGGGVAHSNEPFVLTWDPKRLYWSTTRNFLEQFLRDVADGSGTLSSEYSVTTQYRDAGGHAANASKYGGGCVDFGATGGSQCQIGSGTSLGHDYPGTNGMGSCSNGSTTCVTDADIKGEVSSIVADTQLTSHTAPGYTPIVVVLIPAGVNLCLDSTNTLCSAGTSGATGEFCSYHSVVNGIAYVVQPWTTYTGCDEPKLPQLPDNPTPHELAVDAGKRLVNPLSQGDIAAIVNPGLNAWYANDGSEIDDNQGCLMGGPQADTVTVGNNTYVLRREWNNAGAIESDPNAFFGCAPATLLSPAFVVPSAVNPGDVVAFDGSTTASTLIVPKANYIWDFGDGTSAVGPSVEHSYSKGGSYIVKLTVTDRGGNVQSLAQTIDVLGANGQPVTPGAGQPGSGIPALSVHLQLMPQALRSMLRSGIAVRVSSNEAANGIAQVSITRGTARRVHIKGRGPAVVIGRGTVSSIKRGSVMLHLRLSHGVAAKLRHLRHVTLTVTLKLVGVAHDHVVWDAAGRY